jgi:hypothetical protein
MFELVQLPKNCTFVVEVKSLRLRLILGFDSLISSPIQTFVSLATIIAAIVVAVTIGAFATKVEFITGL